MLIAVVVSVAQKFLICGTGSLEIRSAGMAQSSKSFEDFWTFYLREHGKPVTRGLHIAGTTLSIGFLATALAALANDRSDRDSSPLPWLIGAALAGYGPAWIG